MRGWLRVGSRSDHGNNVWSAASVTSFGLAPSWFTTLTMLVFVSRK